MIVQFHRNFKKQYEKLRTIQDKIDERLVLFVKNQFNPILNNHALSGKYQGCRSINITGDVRAIYKMLNNEEIAYFVAIDTHSNLYK